MPGYDVQHRDRGQRGEGVATVSRNYIPVMLLLKIPKVKINDEVYRVSFFIGNTLLIKEKLSR